MLSEANTIQQTKELKSLFLTAADWAKRKGMGDEAIKYAKSYALEAERKMGEMLRETERAKGVLKVGPQLPNVTTGQHNNEPYQQYVDSGYFKLVRQTWKRAGYEGIYDKTMVTPKGVDFIAKLLLEDGYEYRKR